jgi:hypothetical protein
VLEPVDVADDPGEGLENESARLVIDTAIDAARRDSRIVRTSTSTTSKSATPR